MRAESPTDKLRLALLCIKGNRSCGSRREQLLDEAVVGEKQNYRARRERELPHPMRGGEWKDQCPASGTVFSRYLLRPLARGMRHHFIVTDQLFGP